MDYIYPLKLRLRKHGADGNCLFKMIILSDSFARDPNTT
nr:MAG TPA: Polyubiquitin-C [Caudoviricetes sp.]